MKQPIWVNSPRSRIARTVCAAGQSSRKNAAFVERARIRVAV
jgi:hypothetical protein